ncbi:MAG: hypothetical protein P4N59_26065 [Negativicutes bacterium]|nr:hypothetical protein [Negativicutes bacterium]
MKKTVVLLVGIVLLLMLSGVALAWPQYLDGRPSEYRPGETRGYFIWFDRDGWNLRTASKSREHVYTGVIRTNGEFVDVRGVREEHGDRIRLNHERDRISFQFETDPRDTDGIDFRVRDGDRVNFDLYVDGELIDTHEIHLGRHNIHPHSNDFWINR